MLDLQEIQAFVRVAEEKSFTRAAEQLRLSKSRVSLRVRSLEAALGVSLLQRSTRAVQLTSAGDELLVRAQQLLADADTLGSLFTAPSSLQGRIRVDLPIAFAQRTVIPRLPELLHEHPLLDLHISTTDRRVDLVREGIDCVLRVGALRDSSLVARRLGHMEMMNVASPAYLRKYGTPTALSHLAAHRIIHYGSGAPSFEYDGGELPMTSSLTVNTTDAYEAACLAGLGIIQAPRFGLQGHLAAGALVEILPRHACPAMPVSLVYVRTPNVPRRLQVFMQWLSGVVRSALRA